MAYDSIANVMLRVKARLEALPEHLGDALLEIAQEETPVDSGDLRDAWEVEGGEAILQIKNETPYARVVDVGRTAFAPFPGRHYTRRIRARMPEAIDEAVKRSKEQG